MPPYIGLQGRVAEGEMGRSLRYFGMLVLVVAAWLAVAGELGWLPGKLSDAWFRPVALGGALCLGLGFILGLASPIQRRMRGGRCARCRSPVESGQTYCSDHLRESVQEYQDRLR